MLVSSGLGIKMIKVAHRVNNVAGLKSIPPKVGVEVDVRSMGSKLVLDHDFPANGESLNDFLASFEHAMLVINVKEDGLEDAIMGLPNFPKVKQYFFLDQPIPTMLKANKNGISTAIRVSEYEELPRNVTGAQWVWIDSFTGNWDHLESALQYSMDFNLRTCLVAPELQGRFEKQESMELMANYGSRLDAVCTKNIDLWN